MSSEHAPDVDPAVAEGDADVPNADVSDADAVEDRNDRVFVTVFGFDVVLEEEFVEFPWRAGLLRAPAAALVTFLLVLLVAAGSGVSGGTVAGTLAYVAVIGYGLHQIPVVQGEIPEFLPSAAHDIAAIPFLRGFVLTGPNHGNPLRHVIDIASGKTASIGHVNPLPADPTVPIEVYLAIPVVVLVATGYEFALRYWDDVTVDTVLEVGRFGAAVAAGYVLVLFAGTFFVTIVGAAGSFGQQAAVVLPDRYLTVVFGAVYPALFASLGALLVYAQKRWIAGGS